MFHRLSLSESGFGKELVGETDDFLFDRLWSEFSVWHGEVLSFDVLNRQSGPCMSFADECVSWEPLFTHQLRPDGAMTNVRLSTETLYGRCIAFEDTYVVNHGSLLDKLCVSIQLGVHLYDLKRHVGYAPAVRVEDVVELGILLVVMSDDAVVVHNRLGSMDLSEFT